MFYLLEIGAISALSDSVLCEDFKVSMICLQSLCHVLAVGEREREQKGGTNNLFAFSLEICGFLDKLQELENHPNLELSQKASDMLSYFFHTFHAKSYGEMVSQIEDWNLE